MLHPKIMVIDEAWCIIGSTNFDHRSFALNDEVNVATLDGELAASLDRQYERDLEQSRPLTLEMLHDRTLLGNIDLAAGTVLESES
jgi:cardiolipin synthase A/B